MRFFHSQMRAATFWRIYFFAVLTLCPTVVQADTVIFKTGQTIEGKIVETTSTFLKIDDGANIHNVSLDSISRISSPKTAETLAPPGGLSADLIYKKINPSVVLITRAYPGKTPVSFGSGFIVDPAGIILTNHHVAGDPSEIRLIEVKLSDGTTYPAVVEAWNPGKDICIIAIKAENLPSLPVLPLGDSDQISIGETVYSLGSPLGFESTFTNGILSSVRKEEGISWLQFTAPVSPGNSGGPLINSKGEVIGIVTRAMQEGQNLNFAIPINSSKRLLGSLLEERRNLTTDDEIFADAMGFFNQGDYEKAETYFRRALNTQPNNPEINLWLAESIKGQYGRHEEALQFFEKVILLKPDVARAYERAGFIHGMFLDNYDKAFEYLNKALALAADEENRGSAYFSMATLYGVLWDRKFDIVALLKAMNCYHKCRDLYKERNDFESAEQAQDSLNSMFIGKNFIMIYAAILGLGVVLIVLKVVGKKR